MIMREVLAEEAEHGDRRARLASDVFCDRARKYLGACLAALNGSDAIVFAGGIGENAPAVRARICAELDGLASQSTTRAMQHSRLTRRAHRP
jgi:acetate kinase